MNTAPYRLLAHRILVDGTEETRWEAHKAITQLCSLLDLSFVKSPQQRASLTKQQDRIWRYVAKRLQDGNITPSRREIREACRVSSLAEVDNIMTRLEKRGYLMRMPGPNAAIEMLEWPEEE